MQDFNTPENNNESFVRWQQKTIRERSNTINLFLGMSFATVGFVITQLTGKDFAFKNCFDKILIGVGTIILLLSIIFLVLLVLNRLKGFRKTTEISILSHIKQNGEIDTLREENKKIDNRTHVLFSLSLLAFTIAESMIVIGFIYHILDKFYV